MDCFATRQHCNYFKYSRLQTMRKRKFNPVIHHGIHCSASPHINMAKVSTSRSNNRAVVSKWVVRNPRKMCRRVVRNIKHCWKNWTFRNWFFGWGSFSKNLVDWKNGTGSLSMRRIALFVEKAFSGVDLAASGQLIFPGLNKNIELFNDLNICLFGRTKPS